MTQIPAGWYPDPAPSQPGRPAQVRYWNGIVWTEHVSATQLAHVAPVQEVLPSGPTTPDGQPLASWWHRAAAALIDNVVFGVAGQALLVPFLVAAGSDFSDLTDEWDQEVQRTDTLELDNALADALDVVRDNIWWLVLPTLLASLLYYCLFWRFKGATPGKLILGLKVRLRDHPGQLPWSTVLVRWAFQAGVGTLLYLAILLPASGFVAAAVLLQIYAVVDPLRATWNENRQTIHDAVAGTNVVKVR